MLKNADSVQKTTNADSIQKTTNDGILSETHFALKKHLLSILLSGGNYNVFSCQ